MSEDYLVHITPKSNLEQIRQQGLRGPSYWALEGEVSQYYEETIQDEGHTPMTVRLPLDVLEHYGLEPDFPGLEEPLTYTLGVKEEEVWDGWEQTGKTWQECLELIQSVRVRQDIPEHIVLAHNPHMCNVPTGVKFKL